MSEYIEIETEIDEENPNILHFYTNLPLTHAPEGERYTSLEALAEGSALAQAMVGIEGATAVEFEGQDMSVVRDPEIPWHTIIGDVTAALKDFFL